MGQHVSASFIKQRDHSSSSPNLSCRGSWAPKRESPSLPARPPSSGNSHALPSSPSPVPAKRNCPLAVGSCQDQMALPERWEGEDGLKFHVHPRNGVRICDEFLLGSCPQGENCPLHHTRFPYHWQLKQKESHAWQSVSDVAQQHLEKVYCDVSRVQVTLVDKKGISGVLNFDLMALKSFGPYESIRRLCNTCNSQVNPYFPTKWTWYWKNDNDRREYHESNSSELLSTFEKGPLRVSTEVVGVPEASEPKPQGQMGEKRDPPIKGPLQRRPSYRSLLSLAPFLQTIPKMPSEQLQLSTSGIPGEDPTDEYCGSYPAASLFLSACPTDSGFVQLSLQPLEASFHSTWTLFHESFSENKALVLAIHRIWNEALWQDYIRKKKSMFEGLSGVKKYQLEKHLFYGTWAERSGPICRMNFDPCLSGLFTPIYGQGIYFHVGAEQAHRYTLPGKDGLRYMFLAKVLVGRHISGEQHYRQTKKLLPAQETYESCVDNLENPKVFVTFKRSQCYPYFLICYKLVSDSVALGI